MPKLHHVALTIDLGRSAPFYAAVLPLLGYALEYADDGLQVWKGAAPAPEVLLYAIEGEDSRPHTHGRPGLQHLAVEVEDRGLVEHVHQAVVAGGFPVVHEPRDYPDYAPGYRAVFVTDADGNRWEIAYIPPGAGLS
ncbi:VOC family protein [Nocardia farcinica]|uniref:VOC family protein n=1 Tax=Nocardia farcinica TaxID=37329 RepID=UPI001895B242|nr:VOC family protein [Nocardia farcinica]MBF6422896.1 VOC family protein [Nocardia farcinica]MBF6434506.1 VOC family protein [Nocardia farcinica]MBF6505591.1 VOC family protein [Nocardia farcinica]